MRYFLVLLVLLTGLAGCGDDHDGGAENCRWVRFIPEQGESYYQYTCDTHTDNVRFIPE